MWVVVGIIGAGAIAGGIYWYVTSKKKKKGLPKPLRNFRIKEN